MKEFFKKHSYTMVKMFLTQFTIAILGFSLALATRKAGNVTLCNVTGVFAVLFYLFLLYLMVWEIGFHDRAGVKNGYLKKNLFTGALISLCANSLNFLLAIGFMLGKLFVNSSFFGNLGAISGSIAVLLQGMYSGLMANKVGESALNGYFLTYFLIPLPAILACFMAYIMGLNDLKVTKIMNQPYPESDREQKKTNQNDLYE